MTTTWASADAIEKAAVDWTDAQVTCRVYQHAWRPLTVRHRPGVFTVFQRCGRCHNQRVQEINEQGYPVSAWRMTYQDGYLLKDVGRLGRDGRAVLRLVTLRASYIEEEPTD